MPKQTLNGNNKNQNKSVTTNIPKQTLNKKNVNKPRRSITNILRNGFLFQ